MSNQHPPEFPFDALEFPEELGGTSDLFPAMPTGTGAPEVLRAIRRKLQELDDQLRMLLTMLDRELHAAPVPATTSPRPISRTIDGPAPMLSFRPVDPLPSTLQRDPAVSLHVIEGVFDGQHMVGPDGKQYSVPANYASKSKLVEGDILKLTITPRGAFVYKQISPIERDRRIGALERDDVTGEYVVIVPEAEGDRSAVVRAVRERSDLPPVSYQRYRTLRASITYFRGEPGDEVVLLVPRGAPSTWAAVENLIKR